MWVRCGTARAEFPEGLVELSWDDGEIGTSPYTAMDLSFMTSEYTATQGERTLPSTSEHWRRFALSSTLATIHTYAHGSRRSVICVKTTSTPSVCTAILATTALILTAGTRSGKAPRCGEDIRRDEWVTFALDEPLTVSKPSLILPPTVERGSRSPRLVFAQNRSEDCSGFDDCHRLQFSAA